MLPVAIANHRHEIKPGWFAYKRRKEILDIIFFKGDHYHKIKTFGIKRFYHICKTFRRYPQI